MTAPSSPVPAVEAERIELPGGFWLEHNGLSVNRVYWLNHPERGALFHINVGHCLPEFQDFLAVLSTPTPGRAAEPDTMAEVERLTETYRETCLADGGIEQDSSEEQTTARDALLSAVRTIVKQREVLRECYRTEVLARREDRTRAETAEAQLATREWQDISTAPKDGTKILVFGNMRAFLADRVFIASWDRDIAGGAWMGPQARCIPRCWQPLPEPPLSTSGADR